MLPRGGLSSASSGALLVVLTCTSCPDLGPGSDGAVDAAPAVAGAPLDDETAQALAGILPSAARQRSVPISGELLDAEDVENENTALLEVLDATGHRVGVLRDIFTPVHCVSGVCRAIRFVLVYDAALVFADLYHPASDTHPLMKYWNGEHAEFDATDWQLLRATLRDPPAALQGLASIDDLVVGATETAPTRVEYQDLVIRGAAFTTYEILMYHLETRALLVQVLP